MAAATNSSAVEMSNIVSDATSFARNMAANPSQAMEQIIDWLLKYGLKVLAAVRPRGPGPHAFHM